MLYSNKISYLKKGLNKKSGRNFRGKITVYHKGGGNKINYRIIDFKHTYNTGKVISIEYDPNRSSFIALVYNEKYNKFRSSKVKKMLFLLTIQHISIQSAYIVFV